jgi:hypothetical protein
LSFIVSGLGGIDYTLCRLCGVCCPFFFSG